MEAYNVRLLQEAVDDLEEIVLYIAQSNRAAAGRMYDEIMKKINDLTDFPKRGRPVPDKRMRAAGYRVLDVKPYIIFYRVLNRNILIYHILHGATNYPLLYETILQTT